MFTIKRFLRQVNLSNINYFFFYSSSSIGANIGSLYAGTTIEIFILMYKT